MVSTEGRSPRTVRVHCRMETAPSTAGHEDCLSEPFKADVEREMSGLTGRDKIEVVLRLQSSSQQPPATEPPATEPPAPKRPATKRLERILCLIYVEIERHKAVRDQLLIDVEVLIDGFSQLDRAHSAFFSPSSSTLDTEKDDHGLFNTLALGGTFDHLHSGHKILLTIAAWLTTHRLIVGITDDELLQNKKHASQLEPIEARQEAVRGFVARVGPTGLRTETPRLQDVYGPTATDPTINGLLVSQETLAGAKAIDAIRSQNGLNSLTTYVIDLISNQLTLIPHDHQDLKDLKISSTQIRAWLDSH